MEIKCPSDDQNNKHKADDKMMKTVQELKLEFNRVKRDSSWNKDGIENLNDSTRNSNKSLTSRFKQARDRILGLEDKIENLAK